MEKRENFDHDTSAYTFEFEKKAESECMKLDSTVRNNIKKYVKKISKVNPRKAGKQLLNAHLSGLWRYRVGDYRLIAEIDDKKLIVNIIRIEHRSEVYKNF